MKKKTFRRVLSMALAAVMSVSLLPASVFASADTNKKEISGEGTVVAVSSDLIHAVFPTTFTAYNFYVDPSQMLKKSGDVVGEDFQASIPDEATVIFANHSADGETTGYSDWSDAVIVRNEGYDDMLVKMQIKGENYTVAGDTDGTKSVKVAETDEFGISTDNELYVAAYGYPKSQDSGVDALNNNAPTTPYRDNPKYMTVLTEAALNDYIEGNSVRVNATRSAVVAVNRGGTYTYVRSEDVDEDSADSVFQSAYYRLHAAANEAGDWSTVTAKPKVTIKWSAVKASDTLEAYYENEDVVFNSEDDLLAMFPDFNKTLTGVASAIKVSGDLADGSVTISDTGVVTVDSDAIAVAFAEAAPARNPGEAVNATVSFTYKTGASTTADGKFKLAIKADATDVSITSTNIPTATVGTLVDFDGDTHTDENIIVVTGLRQPTVKDGKQNDVKYYLNESDTATTDVKFGTANTLWIKKDAFVDEAGVSIDKVNSGASIVVPVTFEYTDEDDILRTYTWEIKYTADVDPVTAGYRIDSDGVEWITLTLNSTLISDLNLTDGPTKVTNKDNNVDLEEITAANPDGDYTWKQMTKTLEIKKDSYAQSFPGNGGTLNKNYVLEYNSTNAKKTDTQTVEFAVKAPDPQTVTATVANGVATSSLPSAYTSGGTAGVVSFGVLDGATPASQSLKMDIDKMAGYADANEGETLKQYVKFDYKDSSDVAQTHYFVVEAVKPIKVNTVAGTYNSTSSKVEAQIVLPSDADNTKPVTVKFGDTQAIAAANGNATYNALTHAFEITSGSGGYDIGAAGVAMRKVVVLEYKDTDGNDRLAAYYLTAVNDLGVVTVTGVTASATDDVDVPIGGIKKTDGNTLVDADEFVSISGTAATIGEDVTWGATKPNAVLSGTKVGNIAVAASTDYNATLVLEFKLGDDTYKVNVPVKVTTDA